MISVINQHQRVSSFASTNGNGERIDRQRGASPGTADALCAEPSRPLITAQLKDTLQPHGVAVIVVNEVATDLSSSFARPAPILPPLRYKTARTRPPQPKALHAARWPCPTTNACRTHHAQHDSTPPSVGVCGITRRTLAHRIPVNTSVQNILHPRARMRTHHIRHTPRTILTHPRGVPILELRPHTLHPTIFQKPTQRINDSVVRHGALPRALRTIGLIIVAIKHAPSYPPLWGTPSMHERFERTRPRARARERARRGRARVRCGLHRMRARRARRISTSHPSGSTI